MSAEFAYHSYELGRLSLLPARLTAAAFHAAYETASLLLGRNPFLGAADASAELFERVTRRYPKPSFRIDAVHAGEADVHVSQETALSLPFCNLLRFRKGPADGDAAGPKLLVVAPMSGHHATLLRATVERLIPGHDVYLTDWVDASDVPVEAGSFDLDDYIDYVIAMINHTGPDTHVMAVCQPSVPVLAAVALMSEDRDPAVPRSLILLGGPIDTRKSPTAVDLFATDRGADWFARNVIASVPFGRKGVGRRVYPGFLQLGGFISMNLARHVKAHAELFVDLATGDEDGAARHCEFYDEYLAVMDMTEEFYLDTIRKVFVEHHLPEGRLQYRGRPVRPQTIRRTALMTVEGGRDDITGPGQTKAAHELCTGLPDAMKFHHLEAEAGHYGIFSGSRFRDSVAPAIEAFIERTAA